MVKGVVIVERISLILVELKAKAVTWTSAQALDFGLMSVKFREEQVEKLDHFFHNYPKSYLMQGLSISLSYHDVSHTLINFP